MENAPATEAAAPAETNTPTDNGGGFIESLDSLFSQMDNPTPAPEPTSEPEPAPVESIVEKSVSPESSDEPLDPIDSIEEPKDWTPQAARRFKELKAELKEFKTRAQELEQVATQKDNRLQELEALANNPEYQQLQEQIQQYEQHMMLNRLEQSSVYQQQVEQPLRSLMAETDTIAEKYSIDPNTLIDAIAESDEATQEEMLSEVLANASDRDKFRIYKIIEEVQPILARRQLIMQNVQDALAEAEMLEQTRQQQQLAERAEQRREAAKAVADKLRSKLTFLSAIDGLDMNQLTEEAAAFEPAQADAVTGAYQTMAAKLLPKMASQYLALQKEVDALTERLAEYDNARPKAGGGALATGGAPTTADGKSFLEAVTAAFGG